MENQNNRPHRPTKEKKVPKKGERNPKAFAVSNPGRLGREAARSSDIKEKRLHVPQVDRLPEEAPPIVVAVVGPPGVGKTTLIKSLIKRYSKQTLSHPQGPLTVVTSKRRRLTFLECPSDSLAAMIDVAKIADIVLLMIDGNYGFEMETMEFLNALSVSGMPGNVFGILTHLDLFKRQSTLQAAKKRLKARFWSELYHGAKLFYLSGVINGRYPDRETHNISRFLSVMKNPRPLIWRNSHPYCLADRFLDVTPPKEIEENQKCDRQIALYGYLRGTNFPALDARVHVPGVGDLTVKEIEPLPDPCPTPFLEQAIVKNSAKSSKRRLGEKQKVLFAPMSDVGGVLVDKDAVYIDVKTNTFDRTADDVDDRGLGEQMLMSLQNERRLLGEADREVRLFGAGRQVIDDNDDDDGELEETANTGRQHVRVVRALEDGLGSKEAGEDDDDDHVIDDGRNGFLENGHSSYSTQGSSQDMLDEGSEGSYDDHERDPDAFSDLSDQDLDNLNSVTDEAVDDNSSSDGDVDGALRWKENMAKNAADMHKSKRSFRASDLSRFMYDMNLLPKDVISRWRGSHNQMEQEKDPDDDELFKKTNIEKSEELEDRMLPKSDYKQMAEKWENSLATERLASRFTKSWPGSGANATKTGAEKGEDDIEEFSDEGDGEFVDLEQAESQQNLPTENLSLEDERKSNAKKKEELKLRFEEEDREGFGKSKNEITSVAQDFGEDDWYEAQKDMLQKQLDINRIEFDSLDALSRARAEGFKAGTYARIVLDEVPYEFAKSFNPRYPVIIGGLAPTEDRFGYVHVRIKRHRWHKKILKTNDPLIFSLGWRRFQSLPLYSLSDSRTRNRMIKYTPEHMHCFGTFYGPLVAPNTGFCCVQSFSNAIPGFRIAATGVVLSVDETTEIVKKLKLTGYPYKIFRNTAFIRDMFNTALEIAKFEGASIKTVSGIRGQIKRALSKPEGHFRAAFEDKILMSDIVFLRAWYSVVPHKFYNPVTNLLDATQPIPSQEDRSEKPDDGSQNWQAMRLTGAVRASLGIPTPQQKDSNYHPIDRPTRHFNPLRVPRALAADLPFKSQITQQTPRKGTSYLQKRAVVLGGEEKVARDLMQKLMTLRNEKVEKRAKKQEERRQEYRKKVEENWEKKGEREKRERDDYWRREGRKRKTGGEHTGSRKRTKS